MHLRNVLLLSGAMVVMPGALLGQGAADIQVSPPEVDLSPGDRIQVAATGYSEGGDIDLGASFRWISTDTAVVRLVVDAQSGVATLVAVAPGAAVIEARSGRARGFATVSVKGAARAAAPVVESAATAEARRRVAGCAQLLRAPAPGSWAQWQTDKGTVKLALLGTEERAGEWLYRVELVTTGGPQGRVVVQVLTPNWPNTGERVQEMVMQSGDRPPVKISGQRLASARNQGASHPLRMAAASCKGMTALGTETTTVPAGTFTAHHFRTADGSYESWVDPAVPFGLIKAAGATGGTVALTGLGDGAVSAITGAPVAPGRGGRVRPGRN